MTRRSIFAVVGMILVLSYNLAVLAAESTAVYVDPSMSEAKVGEAFVVSVDISDVTDLRAWEFRLSWDPSILDILSVTEGSFLKEQSPLGTFFISLLDQTEGYVQVACISLGLVPGANGSGTLATVAFWGESVGETILGLSDTTLINSEAEHIAHETIDGLFRCLIDQPVVEAIIDIDADTFSMSIGVDTAQWTTGGRWTTVHIELPEDYDADDIDASTIELNGTVAIAPDAPVSLGDYDDDGIPDLTVKFDKTAVMPIIANAIVSPDPESPVNFAITTVTITGTLQDGTSFKGNDSLKVVYRIK